MKQPTVTIYDPDSQVFTEIPESELAPGMICAQIKGRDGVVWIEPGKLKQSEFRHPPFTGERRELIARIQNSFPDTYEKSYEFWEDGFRRDTNPDSEIAIWLNIAEVYSSFALDKPMEYRRELFSLLVTCSNSGQRQLKSVFESELISDAEIEAISSAYYSKRGR